MALAEQLWLSNFSLAILALAAGALQLWPGEFAYDRHSKNPLGKPSQGIKKEIKCMGPESIETPQTDTDK